MHFGVLVIVAVSAATVWFWPEARVILSEQEWAREAVAAIDDVTGGAQATVVPAKEAPIPEIRGRVVAVSGGDTFTVLTENKQRIRIRLAEIDAPETGQAYGRRARKALSNLIYAKAVRVLASGLDQNGRTLGRVFVRDVDVNAEMVRRGSAHADRAYLRDATLIVVEDEARTARRGLWSMRASHSVRPERHEEPPQVSGGGGGCLPATAAANVELRAPLIPADEVVGARVAYDTGAQVSLLR